MFNRITSSTSFVRTRVLTAFALCSAGILLGLRAFAAVPSSGTLTPANQSITFTDGPLVDKSDASRQRRSHLHRSQFVQ